MQISKEELFEIIAAAYRRGAVWMQDNAASPEFISKAADDYADMTTSTFAE